MIYLMNISVRYAINLVQVFNFVVMKKKTINLLLEIARAILAIIAGTVAGQNSDALVNAANSVCSMIV